MRRICAIFFSRRSVGRWGFYSNLESSDMYKIKKNLSAFFEKKKLFFLVSLILSANVLNSFRELVDSVHENSCHPSSLSQTSSDTKNQEPAPTDCTDCGFAHQSRACSCHAIAENILPGLLGPGRKKPLIRLYQSVTISDVCGRLFRPPIV